MSAGKWSMTIEQGATFDIELQYKDGNSIPISLVGYNGRMQIRPTIASTTVLLSLSSSLQADGTGLNFSGSNGATDPVSGSIGLFISAVTSSALNFDTAYYDIEIQSGSYVTRILEGQVKLSKEVTR